MKPPSHMSSVVFAFLAAWLLLAVALSALGVVSAMRAPLPTL